MDLFAADSNEDLGALPKISKSMKGAAALWIVYPKGQKQITENDVSRRRPQVRPKRCEGRRLFTTHTALKFVIPLSDR